jgi:hypothetical protein
MFGINVLLIVGSRESSFSGTPTQLAGESHPRATRARRPVQRRSGEAELSARFEHEAIPLRDILYRHALRMSRSHADART